MSSPCTTRPACSPWDNSPLSHLTPTLLGTGIQSFSSLFPEGVMRRLSISLLGSYLAILHCPHRTSRF